MPCLTFYKNRDIRFPVAAGAVQATVCFRIILYISPFQEIIYHGTYIQYRHRGKNP